MKSEAPPVIERDYWGSCRRAEDGEVKRRKSSILKGRMMGTLSLRVFRGGYGLRGLI